ncbi:short neuropeptide F [Ceratitis capitata]|uniref:short neuropeptide F n=1 Tax=Ceratitis capitata TaxID=7213 RepID=UPI00032A1E4D|nr:short neuropeptide F [Ceratitis capitata]
MFISNRLLSSLAFVCFSILLWQESGADMPNNNALTNLYNSILQREYAGPVVFPNHQVERKAQRSPSLRLRFGRRSDPTMVLSAQKRWFGDVNQKPIRSPSLRLRFGRRSDPNMPMHSELDNLMNDLALNNDGVTDAEEAAAYFADEYPEDLYDDGFERMARKPQRLRFGRSLPKMQNNIDDELEHEQFQQTDDFYNSLLTTEKLHNMLLALHQYDSEPLPADGMTLNHNNDEFQREVRKPASLRLRFGRSASSDTETQKKSTAQNTINAEKPAAIAAQQQQQQYQQQQQAQAKN